MNIILTLTHQTLITIDNRINDMNLLKKESIKYIKENALVIQGAGFVNVITVTDEVCEKFGEGRGYVIHYCKKFEEAQEK